MELNIDFGNLGYSETDRERAHAAVSKFVGDASGRDMWGKLPTIAAWYANSPYPEDVARLLDVFHTRLFMEYELTPTVEDELFGEDEFLGEDELLGGDDGNGGEKRDKKRLDNIAVESILQCVANDIPTGAIASFAGTVKQIANVANDYLEVVVREDLLYDHELRDLAKHFAGVAGFVDYFTGGYHSLRSDAVETVKDWFYGQPSAVEAFTESLVRGLEYDRRAGTLDQRLPWLRWFFDQMSDSGDDFWRCVFAVDPLPFAQGFLFLVWETDAPFADLERAMWYHRLARFAESGVEWDADDVLHMGRESELVGRALCGAVGNEQ